MVKINRVYLKENVFDAALERIRFIFNEFENVVVSFSGGKDSTVVLNLSLMVAEELGRLPLRVMFIDQEAEWQCVIDYVRDVMYDKRVAPRWLQVPIRIFNASSNENQWLHCWGIGENWMREKDECSIKVNKYGTDRFHKMFPAFLHKEFGGKKACSLGGVRTVESPARLLGLTNSDTYKGITYGNVSSKKLGHYSFYPIYDWTMRDVWKAIHDNGWPYSKIYDYMYQHGVKLVEMRVSNLHHETAIRNLLLLQEIEPDTWRKLTARLSGINSVGHLGTDFISCGELPSMFSDWREYRDYLLENIVTDVSAREKLRKLFEKCDTEYIQERQERLMRFEINSILSNDWHGTKLSVAMSRSLGFRVK